jgi:hypothetical protein
MIVIMHKSVLWYCKNTALEAVDPERKGAMLILPQVDRALLRPGVEETMWKLKAKAVPPHAMKAFGGEEV